MKIILGYHELFVCNVVLIWFINFYILLLRCYIFLRSCTGGYMSCVSVAEERWAEGGKHSVFYV